MEYTKKGENVIIRLDPDEEVIENIRKICRNEKITSGFFMGIGALKKVILRFFKQQEKDFIEKTFQQQFEVTSLMGNISTDDNEPYLHSHIVLANDSFDSISGHFHKGWVGATAEIYLRSTEIPVDRQYSEEIGLNLFKFFNSNT